MLTQERIRMLASHRLLVDRLRLCKIQVGLPGVGGLRAARRAVESRELLKFIGYWCFERTQLTGGDWTGGEGGGVQGRKEQNT